MGAHEHPSVDARRLARLLAALAPDREGEWVCAHGPCPVRRVRLRVRAAQAAHLPRLRCPLCLRVLEFRRWLPAAP
jgi:hypothetical protein